ncbi:MAG TPA: magnesium transporter [Vicinamibacterales bacterium]|nr:magnesium transporter [Vicinamibacterales bacterium]
MPTPDAAAPTIKQPVASPRAAELAARLSVLPPFEAAKLLRHEPDDAVAQALAIGTPAAAIDILWQFPDERRQAIVVAAPPGFGEQWLKQHEYPEGSVGRLMEPPLATFRPTATVAETVADLQELVRQAFITYGFVTEEDGRLVGVITFRELLFADPMQPLTAIMVAKPFSLHPQTPLVDAMREVVTKHYPVYPVTDEQGRLVGMVRGQNLFRQQAFEISAQAGAMVGVEKEERLATAWPRSLKMRHPWLQLNLITAFVAAAVVGIFQDTIDRLVVLAVFLPVLAGQSGNTGCQALAVTLRGMTLGELKSGRERRLVMKEALLGLLNGALTGLVAGLGMYIYARMQSSDSPLMLAAIVCLAMVGSCVISGISGAMIPLGLRKAGADPATASSIFLTTATDVASMGMFLGLATLLI